MVCAPLIFSNTFWHFSRRAKIVKKCQKIFSTLFDKFRAAPIFRPLKVLGGSDFRACRKYDRIFKVRSLDPQYCARFLRLHLGPRSAGHVFNDVQTQISLFLARQARRARNAGEGMRLAISLSTKSTRKNPPKIKKVHLNESFWTISVGFLTRATGKQGKVSRELFDKVRVNSVFFFT